MRIRAFLRTILSYTLIFLVGLFILPILTLVALLPEKIRFNNKLYFLLLYLFYKSIILFSFLPKKIEGTENLLDEPVIYVANHESSIDIPLVGYINGIKPHTWLVLEYYAKSPVLGFFVRRMMVSVDRANKVKAGRSLVNLLKRIESYKLNVIIYPEGTRIKKKKVHAFFPGFAILAEKTGRPVIPIYMPNNASIYPVGSFLINWDTIEAKIGKPFIFNKDETVREFTARVHEWFISQVNN